MRTLIFLYLLIFSMSKYSNKEMIQMNFDGTADVFVVVLKNINLLPRTDCTLTLSIE